VPSYKSNSLRDYGEIELDGKTLEGSDTRQRVEMAVLQRVHISWHRPGCSCKPHSKNPWKRERGRTDIATGLLPVECV